MSGTTIKRIMGCAALGAVLFVQGCCCWHHGEMHKKEAYRSGTSTEMRSTMPHEETVPPAPPYSQQNNMY